MFVCLFIWFGVRAIFVDTCNSFKVCPCLLSKVTDTNYLLKLLDILLKSTDYYFHWYKKEIVIILPYVNIACILVNIHFLLRNLAGS